MFSEFLEAYIIPIALRILLAIAVWIVGRWLARRSQGWLTRSLQNADLTESFVVLITTVSYYGILILAALLVMAALGVPVTALGAVLGVVVVVLANLLAADERILAEPPARVFVQQLGDSSVELVAWPFVKAEDYAAVQAELVEQVKREFDAVGINMPYPQQDVHLYAHNE
jgi:small-conductance mechanosensitive channel